VLGSLADALLPPLPVPPNQDSSQMETRQYWEHRLSSDPAFVEAIEDVLNSSPEGGKIRFVLRLLSTSLGTSLLTGRPSIVPLDRMSREQQTSLLMSMMGVSRHGEASLSSSSSSSPSSSSTALLRLKLARSLKNLIVSVAYSYTVAGKNPYWPAMEYMGAPQLVSNEGGKQQHQAAAAAAAAIDDTSRTVAAMADAKWIHAALLQLTPPTMASLRSAAGDADHKTTADEVDGGKQPNLNQPQSQDEHEITCDVLIIGSGAGGCVAASVLARAGYRVLVVEKGPYVSPASVTNLESPSFATLYEQGGTLRTSDGAVTILAGSTLGGGTAVNWACCLPLPEFVRDEWSAALALADHGGRNPDIPSSSLSFSSPTAGAPSSSPFGVGGEYDKALDYVLIKLGVVDARTGKFKDVVHNPMNARLQAGCNILGYAWDVTGQNLKDVADPYAGYLCFGDRYGNKLGGVSVFLRDAARHGARILPNCRVRRVLIASSGGDDAEAEGKKTTTAMAEAATVAVNSEKEGEGMLTPPPPPPAPPSSSLSPLPIASGPSRPRAIGARCVVGKEGEKGRNVSIRARKAVVVASGALHSPCILQRSGLGNPHIGQHLRLHPVTNVVGLYGKDTIIDPYLGAPMTTVCGEFELGPLGDGYGARIECPSAHPGLLASGLGWRNPESFKDQMRQVRHSVPLVILQRDTSEGSVRPSRDGRRVVVDYRINDADRASMLRALGGGLQILLASGAKYVSTSHTHDPGLALADDHGPQSLFKMASNEQIQNYLSFVSSLSLGDHEVGLFSAHQMGTCRMSASPLTGAVDLNGETWDCDNLYVMDASVFPTASGVNPMVTVMAVAKMLSSRLAARMRYQDRKSMGTFESVRAREMLATRHELRSNQYPSYSQHTRHGVLHSKLRIPPRLRVLVPLLLSAAALILAASLAALVLSRVRQGAVPAPAPAAAGESWMDSLAKTVGDIKMPGLIPTSVMWTLLLFPFF
jgi:choline dehydrogenase-like flavoprotein